MPVMQDLREMPVRENSEMLSRPAELEENYHEEHLKAMLKESKKGLLKKWDVYIEHLDSGCLVRIGCKKIAFSHEEEAMVQVNNWQNDPHTTLKRWYLELQ